MAKFTKSLPVLSNRKVTEDYFVLRLQGGNEVKDILPGQFVQVRVDNGGGRTFLRRPISVYDIDRENNTMDLLIKIAGKGTEALSALVKNEILNIIYPLGNSFSVADPNTSVLLVGGGVGVAPLFLAGKMLSEAGADVEFLLGYRSALQIIDYKEFASIGNVHITTEDGSEGTRGFVTDHQLLKEPGFDRIYSCGPDPMMRAVSEIANRNRIHCEVSLENLMGCGIGVCLCCIEETVNGNVCTCTDGPVFNIKDLKWQI